MAKISVIGISGASYFMTVDHFHENGETLSADTVHCEMGGKGLNQAIAAVRMKAEVSFLVAVGNDDGAVKTAECCRENGIRCFLAKKADPTATAFILTDRYGENRVTVYRGAQLEPSDVDSFEEELATSDILLLQNEVPEEVNLRASELAEKHGVRIILNPAPARPLPEELVSRVWLVTPNEQESRLIDLKRFPNTVVTLGKKGCLINGETAIPSTSHIPVDTTGAGDTFNGVLSVCVAEGMSLHTACRYANMASGISVTRKYVIDAIPKRTEIERNLRDE